MMTNLLFFTGPFNKTGNGNRCLYYITNLIKREEKKKFTFSEVRTDHMTICNYRSVVMTPDNTFGGRSSFALLPIQLFLH